MLCLRFKGTEGLSVEALFNTDQAIEAIDFSGGDQGRRRIDGNGQGAGNEVLI